MSTTSSASSEEATIKYVCGVDIGSQSCVGCVTRPDRSIVVKSVTIALAREGWPIWEEKLSQLDAAPSQILIGMEATSCYHENLYHELEQRGYVLRLLHPGQTHQFHERQGLRAKTDRLDAMTISRVLLSGEARAGYVPSDQVTTYRELVRLHTCLSDEAAAYQNEIQALVVVLFPFSLRSKPLPADKLPSPYSKRFPVPRPWPRQVLSPSSICCGREIPAHYGRPTARKLVALAEASVSSGRALVGRSLSLRILCDQLQHTQANLARLESEIENLLTSDPAVKGLQQVPGFGPKTVAVLRAELGEVQRFARTDEVIGDARHGHRDPARAANGAARPSFPSGGVACCVACSTWPRCAAFLWRAQLLGLTITVW